MAFKLSVKSEDPGKNLPLKERVVADELSDRPKIRKGDLISFEGRYALYGENIERWVIQLTPTRGLVVNIDKQLVTIFTGEHHCVIDCGQTDVAWTIMSSTHE